MWIPCIREGTMCTVCTSTSLSWTVCICTDLMRTNHDCMDGIIESIKFPFKSKRLSLFGFATHRCKIACSTSSRSSHTRNKLRKVFTVHFLRRTWKRVIPLPLLRMKIMIVKRVDCSSTGALWRSANNHHAFLWSLGIWQGGQICNNCRHLFSVQYLFDYKIMILDP